MATTSISRFVSDGAGKDDQRVANTIQSKIERALGCLQKILQKARRVIIIGENSIPPSSGYN